MQILEQIPGTELLAATMTKHEAQLWGCLEDACNDVVATDGPPGKLWYQNVDLAPAMRLVAAFAEVLTRTNGLARVVDDLVEALREPVVGDGLPRLPWRETEAFRALRWDENALLDVLSHEYTAGEFDGSLGELEAIGEGRARVRGIGDARRQAIRDALREQGH